jgi:type I restriction enzyme S subunit
MLDEIKNTVYSGFVLRARPTTEKIVPEYNQYCYSSDAMRHEVICKSSITTRALTSGPLLGKVRLNIPSKPEQKRIVEILMKWDEAVTLQEQYIEKLERKRHAAIQIIFDSRKLKNKIKLGNLVREKSSRNTIKCTNVKSVSNKYGFINQMDQFTKQVASEDISNYKLVSKDNIAYNPSRINVGSIAIYNEEECGIVSPMYVVFSCHDISPKLILLLLETKRGRYEIQSYLSGSVRNSLSFSDLCEIELFIPDNNKQKKIVKLFGMIDAFLKMQKDKLEKLKLQRNSIQQILLHGIVRV